AYGKLEATTKRLEMRTVLAGVIKALSSEELPEVLYLSQGLMRPEYEGVELGMADSLAAKAVAQVTGTPEPEILATTRQSGDLGTTAEALLSARDPPSEQLTVAQVYRELRRIAEASGEGSQETKVSVLTELLRACTAREARYVVRFVLGKLRLGVREMTILDALAEAFGGGTKEARGRIEGAFNVSSDLGLVAQALAAHGLDGLSSIHLTVGRPVRPMLAERSPDLTEVMKRMEGRAALEYKYDGLRVQAHVPAEGPVRLFSRRLEDISAQFPELLSDLPKALRRKPAIVEGECVSIDPETDEIRPFQEISRRRGRKYDLERMQQEVPVCLFLFDVLLDGTNPMLGEPFSARRERLVTMLRPTERTRLAVQQVVEDVPAAQSFFDASIADGCEGIMAKSLAEGSIYHPGGRGFWWIKYKREYTQGLADSIDGVVVGAFHGKGRRGGKYGALLMAVYNPDRDRYESFCKVGSGFDDAALDALPPRLKPLEVHERPEGVVTELTPDRWITPQLVLEIRGAELSLSPNHRAAVDLIRPGAGLALRFPRFTGRYREDKGPTDATTSQELVALYQSQVRHAAASSDVPE
ncbi:MAG: ATP-dependent DNA ligase, partial [Thermoplasmata archaeon]|nr:ATP-dependent DNA ligase [Thermoplasmata archaeon]